VVSIGWTHKLILTWLNEEIKMMYTLTICFSGEGKIDVEANNKKEAIELVQNMFLEDLFKTKADLSYNDIEVQHIEKSSSMVG
jgi:hypothetical protein